MVFIGGFLGAGKTTLAYHLARALNKQDLAVSVVMNDLGNVLVDTQFMKNAGMDAREVTGSCFCVRFDEFLKDARSLVGMRRQDVIIAEPIGVSTSVLASVITPLRSQYDDEFSVAPLMVVIDSHNFLSEMASAGPDWAKTHLIFMQQLREAEVLVLSKQDLLRPGEDAMVRKYAKELAPDAEMIEFSARDLKNLGKLVEIVRSDRTTTREAPKVDPRTFAGEKAALGWYSASMRISTDGERLDIYDLMTSIMKGLSREFEPSAIAHIKVLISSPKASAKMSLVQESMQVDGVKGGRFVSGEAELVLNARAVASPEKLRGGIEKVLDSELARSKVAVLHKETACFVPRAEIPKHVNIS